MVVCGDVKLIENTFVFCSVVFFWRNRRGENAVRVDQVVFAVMSCGDRMFSMISLAFQSRILKLKHDFSDDRVIIRLSSRGSIEDVEFYSDEIWVLIDNDDLSLWKTPTLCTKAFARLDAAHNFNSASVIRRGSLG